MFSPDVGNDASVSWVFTGNSKLSSIKMYVRISKTFSQGDWSEINQGSICLEKLFLLMKWLFGLSLLGDCFAWVFLVMILCALEGQLVACFCRHHWFLSQETTSLLRIHHISLLSECLQLTWTWMLLLVGKMLGSSYWYTNQLILPGYMPAFPFYFLSVCPFCVFSFFFPSFFLPSICPAFPSILPPSLPNVLLSFIPLFLPCILIIHCIQSFLYPIFSLVHLFIY